MTDGTKIRVGAVSYLNTKPLVYGLQANSPEIQLEFALPSKLADGLADGRYDVALIPSIEFFRHDGYAIVSDACIACRGPVLSVKLLSRCKPQAIRTIALDEGSRTSVALTRVLLHARYGIQPTTVPLPIGAFVDDVDTDAVLLIGDRAIHEPAGDFEEIWDLGDEWCKWSEHPFVFAMWVAATGFDASRVAVALESARDDGIANLSLIAEREAPLFGLTTGQCLTYLQDNLYFHLGKWERLGLELFRSRAAELDLIPRDRMLPLPTQTAAK